MIQLLPTVSPAASLFTLKSSAEALAPSQSLSQPAQYGAFLYTPTHLVLTSVIGFVTIAYNSTSI